MQPNRSPKRMPSGIKNGQVDAVVSTSTKSAALLKGAQDALRDSEESFRILAEVIPQIVWITRPDGGNIYFNQKWMDYTGLTLAESLDHGWIKPFHPEDRQLASDAWQHATVTVGEYEVKCRLRRADGIYRWWLIRGAPRRDAAGNVTKWFGTCTDIHDLKMASQEMREIATNMATAQRIAHFGSWELVTTDTKDIDANALHWSDEMYRIAGYEPGAIEASNELFFLLVPPEDHAPIRDAIATAIRERQPYSIVHRLIRRDGEERVLHETGEISFNEQTGQPAKIVGTAHDITESRRAEHELRASELQRQQQARILQSVMKNMGDGVVVCDETGKFLLFNPAAEEMLRTGATTSPPEKWSEHYRLYKSDGKSPFPTSDLPMVKALQGESSDDTEMIVNRTGDAEKTSWISVNGRPLRDEAGVLRGGIAVMRDITGRKKIEQSRTLFRALIDKTTDGIEVIDPKTGRFLDVNERTCLAHGYTRDELLNMGVTDIDPEVPAWADLTQAGRFAAPHLFESTHRRKDGSIFPVEVSHDTILLEREYLVAVVRDITERKRVEAELQLRNRALAAAGQGLVITDSGQTDNPVVYASPGFERMTG